jgi:hypothetical protein
MADAITPREQAISAFQRQLGAALDPTYLVGGVLPRNQPQPADLATGTSIVILVDGPEHEPMTEPLTGYTLRQAVVHVEGYVRVDVGQDPGPVANDLLGRVLAGALADRTCGGVLYGKLTAGILKHHGQEGYYAVDRPHLDSLEEGTLDVEVFRKPGAPGMGFAKEFLLQYATTPDDPQTLVPFGTPD